MLSKNARNMILKTTVALTVGLTSVVAVNYKEPVMVEAATVINEVQGVVTVKVSSIWTYSKADWNARTKVFNQGTKFNSLQKIAVSGKEMYRLDNGLYISANPSYVSFQAATGSAVTTPPVSSVETLKTGKTTVNLNMRTGAGTGNAIMLTIPKSSSVTINSTSGAWTNVTYNGKKGWVSSQYLTGITTVTSPSAPVTPAPVTPAPVAPITAGTSKTKVNLNMRSGAGTGSAIILTIPSGGTVTVHSTSNGWSNVTYSGKTGWVSAQYLTAVTPPAPTVPAPTTPAPVTPAPVTPAPVAPVTAGTSKTTENLNMRSGASTSNKIILTIPKGSTVTVHSTSNGWSNVTYNGKTGWASSQYMTAVTPPAQPAPTVPAPVTPAPEPVVPGIIGTSKTTVNLNMRSGAGTGNAIILTIPMNGEVSIYSTSNGWSNVTYNGKKGWVSSQYLTAMVSVTPPQVEKPKEETPVVVKKPAVLLIDEPKSTYNNENINIFGRAVTMDGVTSVTATINGKTINVERYDRPELNTLYSEGYNLEKLGFRFTIDKTTLAVGNHTLVVSATAKDGTVKKVTSTFNLTKPAPVMTIRGITDGQAVPTSGVTVSGYALNADGVTGMKYYVNGVDKGAVNYGTASSDTGSFSTYTGYKNANYSFTLNGTDFYSNGMNSLRVEMLGKDGTLYSKTYVLRGSATDRYIVEEQSKTRDEYAVLETKKSVWPKISHGGFVNATMNEIQYHLDPGNFIYDEANKYMFMDLRYDEDLAVTAAQLDNMLMNKGVLHDMGEAFLLAGQTYNVNPIYLASHAILETGHGTSTLAKGQKVTATYAKFGDESTIIPDSIPEEDKEKLVYNVFGIGAWDTNPNLWGAQKAYEVGNKWFTVEEAIMGGAKWIGQNYINRSSSQNTLFKMRFNFPEGMNHEYATDLGWAQKQAKRIKEQIEVYMLKNPGANLNLKFYYPKFK